MQTRTRRQREVLEYITGFIEKNGHAPSYQTVARYLKIASKTAVGKHITSLEEQGLLHRQRIGKSFRLVVGKPKNNDVPENSIEWLPAERNGNSGGDPDAWPFSVPDFVLGDRDPADMLAFRMPDDGMAEKNICEGDIILVEKRKYGRDGDFLAVTINGSETTLRKFYRRGADVELRSSNDDFPALCLAADDIEIHGVYRGLLRPAP